MKAQIAKIPAALQEYKASNGKDNTQLKFLAEALEWSVKEYEDYDLACEIAETLFAYPLDEEYDYLYTFAAFAAFCADRYDRSKEWSKTGLKKNALAKADPTQDLQLEGYLTRVMPYYEEAWIEEKGLREKEDAAQDLPRVLMSTTAGDITFELFLNEAPNAVNNFLTLVDQGYYNGVIFHRVLPHFMAQGGDPTGKGTGGPGYYIPCECSSPDARNHFRGSLSMAHAGRDTGGSQFFITFMPTFFLNGKHTVFGRVVEGMNVLAELQRIDPERPQGVEPSKIVSAKILRGKPGEFKKLPERRRFW